MADNTNRIAGTCFISADGVRLALSADFTYRVSTPSRESKVGQDGYHGYKEKITAGQIKAKLRDTSSVSLVDLGNMTNVTIVAELANGKTVIGRNMVWVGDAGPGADAEEAEIEATWEGPDVQD